MDGLVVAESGEEFPVRLLDCDSITQAKEKVLDVLYKNTPVSKRPQLTKTDLGNLFLNTCVLIASYYCEQQTNQNCDFSILQVGDVIRHFC